jgi:uncharacterized protein YcbX
MTGTSPQNGRVAALFRYPVKGLSAEPLDTVSLAAGATFPMDRAYALENGPSGFDPTAPAWQPKAKFLCLMRNARLAALSTRYDDGSRVLSIREDGTDRVAGDLSNLAGRQAIEDFFQDYMGEEARGPIRLLQAPGHSFSDLSKKVVSLINLDTLRAFGDAIGRDVHRLRFRANLYIEGLPAGSELDLVGTRLAVGTAELKVIKRTVRCAATQVDPERAVRNLDVPAELMRQLGHADCGVYAEVVRPGDLTIGSPVRLLS